MTEMTKITFFVDDRQVGKVQRLLASVGAYDVQSVPVVNAKKGKNGVEAETTTGTAGELFIAKLIANKAKTFDRAALKQFMSDNGYSVNSTTYVLAKLIEDRLIKKTTTKNVYAVKP